MSRKRKNDVEGDDSSRNNSTGNDTKKKSKKQIDNVKSKIEEGGPSFEGGGGGEGGDTPWSKSKKKRMRLLKSKLLKKQEHPSVDNVKAVAKNSYKEKASTATPASSPKQQQAKPATTDSSSKRTNNNANNTTTTTAPSLSLSLPRTTSALQQAFKARLSGSRFRILNEELYTTTSSTAFERFSSHPELYDEYHDGFRSQVEHWPVNPVDVIVGRLKKDVDIFVNHQGNSEPSNNNNNKHHQQQQNRINNKHIVVADFGCGDADLAKQLLKVQIPIQQQQKRQKGVGSSSSEETTTFWCPFCVHSFDLVSKSDLVTACDMSKVPLPNGTVDVAVFCLSLMGTNLADFVREAHRVLKSTGRLKIAEVKSRFSSSTSSSSTKSSTSSKSSMNNRNNSSRNQKNNNNSNAGGQDEEREFIQVLKQLGFECTRTDRSNKMFVLFELRKNGKTPDPKVEYTAKPCIYKRR